MQAGASTAPRGPWPGDSCSSPRPPEAWSAASPRSPAFAPTLDCAAAATALAATASERGVVVAGTNDPFCPEGAEHAYARPLDLDFVPVEGGGHLTIDDGYGPFPLVLELAVR